VVVAVSPVRVVQMVADQIVDVSCVRDGVLAAPFAVDMVPIVESTVVGRCTGRGIVA